MHSTRIDMVIVYLIMRDRRSASGEGGSVVIDCCFMVVAVGRAALLSLKPTSVRARADAPIGEPLC